MSKLPIPIDACPRRYADMTAEGPTSRHCEACDKSVHDLSALTQPEAAALLAERDDLCVRFLYAPDGRVVHRAGPKRHLGVWMSIAAVAAAPLLLEACGGAPARYDYPPAQEDVPDDADVDERGADEAPSAGGSAEE